MLNRPKFDVASRRRWTLIAAILGLNITILDETVVFLLLLVAGSLADLLGRRRVCLDTAGTGVLQLARNRPTSALEIQLTGPLRAEVLPVLQTASINAYRAAMGTGVVIAIMGALAAFLGIRNPRPTQ